MLQTQTIRTEIEDGVKLGKDQTREKQEAVRKEHERWEGMKGLTDNKKGPEVCHFPYSVVYDTEFGQFTGARTQSKTSRA